MLTLRFDSFEETLDFLNEDDSWRRFQVDYQPARSDDGLWRIQEFDIPMDDYDRYQIIRDEGPDRDPGYGTFRKILQRLPDVGPLGGEQWKLWMSDTRAEIMEHAPLWNALFWNESRSDLDVLINGLGLGMAVHGVLSYRNIRSVDVVEIDESLVKFIEPLIDDPRVTLYVADAHTIAWPRGKRWNLAWHDIWPRIAGENVPSMQRLHRRYGNRVEWQDSWQRKGHLQGRMLDRQADALQAKINALKNGERLSAADERKLFALARMANPLVNPLLRGRK